MLYPLSKAFVYVVPMWRNYLPYPPTCINKKDVHTYRVVLLNGGANDAI